MGKIPQKTTVILSGVEDQQIPDQEISSDDIIFSSPHAGATEGTEK